MKTPCGNITRWLVVACLAAGGGCSRRETPPDAAPPTSAPLHAPTSRSPATAAAGLPSDSPTFARDVAPIVFESCAPCHHPGGPGPFSLLTYAEVRKRADQIEDVTARRYMPPWLAASGPVHFVGERRLDDAKLETIRRWVEAGAPEGGVGAMPKPPSFPEGWQLGKPDLVVEMPAAFTTPAEGIDLFRNFRVPVGLPRDRYVRAFEFRPGNPKAVHHAVIMIDRARLGRRLDGRDGQPGFTGIFSELEMSDGRFLGWTPGRLPVADEESPWTLPAGADLAIQLHLPTTGKPETVRGSIGLYFTERAPTNDPVKIRLGTRIMDIPPGKRDHTITDRYELPVDALLTDLLPHAHYLCRDMVATATLPDGGEKVLIHIPDWDFNWQTEFRLAEPIWLPRGTVLSIRYVYDNGAENPRNPHKPPARVRYGPRTTDEMCDLWVQLIARSPRESEQLRRDFRRKDLEAYAAAYRDGLRDQPDNARLHHELASILVELGRPDEGLAEESEAVRLAPGVAEARTGLGRALASRGRFDEAVRQFAEAVRINPGSALEQYDLGIALVGLGQPGQAVEHLAEAVRLAPDIPQAQRALGEALQRAGRSAQSLGPLREAVRLDPSDAAARYYLGNAIGAAGDTGGAIEQYREALRLRPDWPAVRCTLGDALVSQGKRAEAIVQYREALRIAPDFREAATRLAWLGVTP